MPRALDDEILKYNFSDVEYTLSGSNGFGLWLRLDGKLSDEYLGPLKKENVLTVNVYQMHQKSRGYVALNSLDPFDQPHTFFNYFSEKSDLDTLAVGALRMADMLRSPPFAELGIKIYEKPFPKCKELQFLSLDYFRCLVKYTTHANFHYAGTAQMGCNRRSNPLAVVNERCKVYDMEGLRIADTSISHALPQGHSMAFAYLAGATCGDKIIEDYGAPKNTKIHS